MAKNDHFCLIMAHRNGLKWAFPWDRVGEPGMAKKWPLKSLYRGGRNGPKNDPETAILDPENGHFYGVLMAGLTKSRVQNGLEMAVSLG